MKLTCPHCPATCSEPKNMKRFAKRHGDHCIKKKRREFVKVLAAER